MASGGSEIGRLARGIQWRAAAKKPSAENSHVKLESSVSNKREMPETTLETPGPSSSKRALGFDGHGDEPYLSLKRTAKRTRIDDAGGLLVYSVEERLKLRFAECQEAGSQGDEPLLSLKTMIKRSRIDAADDLDGQGDEPPNEKTCDSYPEAAKDTYARRDNHFTEFRL